MVYGARVFIAGLFWAFLLCAVGAQAAQSSQTFRKITVSTPSSYNDPVVLEFELDDQACKKAYGDNWEQRCAAVPGLPDEPGRDIALEPMIAGSWWWVSPYRLAFSPDKSWPVEQNFTVRLGERTIRPGTRLTTPPTVSFTTLPDAARVTSSTLWIDPSPEGRHGVSFVASFLYPQPEGVSRAFDLRVEALPGDQKDVPAGRTAKLGLMRLVWNQERTEASVNAPVTGLGDIDSSVSLRLKGYPLMRMRNGGVSVFRDRTPEGRLLVAAKNSLLTFDKPRIQVVTNADLQKERQLTIVSNALLGPDVLVKHLKAVQLPRVRDAGAPEPYAWDEAPVITDADLARGTPLTLQPCDASGAPSSVLSFRLPDFDISKGRYVHVSLPAGLQAPSGIALGKDYAAVVTAPSFDRDLRFMQPGSILALGSNGRLGLQASGLEAIRWHIAQVMPEYISQMSANAYSFAVPRLPLDAYGTRTSGRIALQRGKPGSPQFATLDLKPLLENGKGIFSVELEGLYTREDGKEEQAVSVSRFVLATDLGLMAKKGADGRRSIFVCSLSESTPLSRVRLEVLGANGLPVLTTQSSVEGRADLPSLEGLRREKAPTVIVARRGADFAFLPLNDDSLARNSGGYGLAGRSSGLPAQAHVFSQRGMYRPGETLHFAAIARNADFTPLTPDLPLVGVLVTPGGRELRQPVKVDAFGMLSCSWPVPEAAATGDYTFNLCVADGSDTSRAVILGSTTVSVEEFQPDILSIKTDMTGDDGTPLGETRGWIKAEKLNAVVQLSNLFGMPAQNRRVKAGVSAEAYRPRFPGFADYTIHVPESALPCERRALPELSTDDRGSARLHLDLARLIPDAWGRRLSTLVLDVEGFEPGGGRSVRDVVSFAVSPLDYVLASKASARLSFIPRGRVASLEFLALDNTLQRVDPGELTFIVSEPRTVVNLVSDSQGAYRYEQVPANRELSRQSLRFSATDAGPALTWPLPTQTPGDRLLDVRDADGNLLASIPFTVAGQALARDNQLVNGILRARLDKTDYAPGETIRIALTTPFDGLGLLTLERDAVLSHVWFRAPAGESVQQIDIPKDFEGRGYVNISFIRSLKSPDIHMQPHVRHVEPLTVNIARRDLALKLEAPDQVQPGETVTVRVSAKDKGRAVVFAVDEGVLQLSRFETPSPLDVLLRQRQLEVQTMQAFDLLMPDQRHIQGLLSAFGGGDFDLGQAPYLNPFKRKGEPPIATWSELVDVSPEGTDVSFTVPDYFSGTVRIMAVGSGLESVGSAWRETRVHGPLVLTPQFPLMVAPGDEFEVSFGIANTMEQDTGLITLTVDPGDRLEVIGQAPDKLFLEPGAEAVLPLRLRARDNPGNARFTLTAEMGDQRAVRSANLSVRPAAPRMSRLEGGFTRSELAVPMDRSLYPFDAAVEFSASGLPLPMIRGLIRYLDAYPYGCTEQVLSAAFPYALLLQKPELLRKAGEDSKALRERTEAILRACVDTLRSRYLEDEGLPLWNGYEADTLITAYAADFLLTLRQAGYGLAADLERGLIQSLRSRLNTQIASPEDARAQAYAIWVLSRFGDVTTRQLTRLIDYVRSDMPEWNQDITAPLMAAAFAMLRLDGQATEALDAYTPGALPDDGQWSLFDPLARDALYLTVLAGHFPDRLSALSADARQALLDKLVDGVRTGSYTTFAAAQGIRALLALSDASPLEDIRLACDDGAAVTPLDLGPSLVAVEAPACTAFRVSVPEGHPGVYWQLFSDGFDRRPSQDAASSGLEVGRELLDDNGEPVESVELGDEVTVRLTLRGYGKPINNVAVVSLLPGGFELTETSADVPRAQADPLVPDSVDRREDRVIVFGVVTPREQQYSYRIRAVNKGRYALPPVYAEAMYDQSLRTRSVGGTVEVR